MNLEKLMQQSKSELISILKILEEQEKALSRDALKYYKPHSNGVDGGQVAFHKSKAMIRLLVTGNRWGKTECSVADDFMQAIGIHPYHQMPIPNKIKIYAASYSTVSETILPKIKKFLSEDYLNKKKPFDKNQHGDITGINFANGSYIKIGTYDQQDDKAEGSNWNRVHFDEPPPRELYIANLRGIIDSGGDMIFSMTPLKEKWIFDELWMPGLNKEKPYIQCFRGTTFDNPHIDAVARDIFVSEMTESEKDVRIYGNFAKLQGVVIDTYESSLSDVDPFELNSDFVIYEGIDPHPAKPHTALWKAIHRSGLRFVCGELYFAGGIYDFGAAIADKRDLLTRNGAVLVSSICDTSLNQKDPAFRTNLKDELCRSLRDNFQDVMPYNAQKKDWVLPGIQVLKDLYRPVMHHFTEEELKTLSIQLNFDKVMPMEYVFKDCKKYRYELTHYQWGDKLGDDQKPVARDNDAIDCNRYIESVAPRYHTPGSRFIANKAPDAYRRR